MSWLWLIAGPNGAGKTTLAKALERGGTLNVSQWLNPDELAKKLQTAQGEDAWLDASLNAAITIEKSVRENITKSISFAVETVLSSGKYRAIVREAHAAGFMIGMVYVVLSSPDLAVLRVKTRVEAGGHNVPEEKIRSRWERSLDQLVWYSEQVDELYVFCNDDLNAAPTLLAKRIVHQNKALLISQAVPLFGKVFSTLSQIEPQTYVSQLAL